MKILRTLLVVLALSSFNASAAGNWDDGYRPYQDVAPEYLEIEVNKVTTDAGSSFYASSSRVTIEARVTQVFRSSTGLTIGAPLTIAYTRKSQAGTAVLEPTIPAQGSVVPAFLRKKGNRYEPAALHHSFVALTSQQLQVLSRLKTMPGQKTAQPAQTTQVAAPKSLLKKPNVSLDPSSELATETIQEPLPEPPIAVVIPAIPEENFSAVSTGTPELIVTEPVPFVEGDQPIVSSQSVTSVEQDTKDYAALNAIQEPMPAREVETIVEQPVQPLQPTESDQLNATVPVVVSQSDGNVMQQEVALVQETVIQAEEKKAENTVLPVEEPVPVVLTAEPTLVEPMSEAVTKIVHPAPTEVFLEPVQTTVQNSFSVQAPAAVAPPAPSSEGVDQDGVTAYSMIFAKIKEADSAVDKNEIATAKAIYESALNDLKRLKETKPEFQPFIVEYRQRDITRKLKALETAAPKIKPWTFVLLRAVAASSFFQTTP